MKLKTIFIISLMLCIFLSAGLILWKPVNAAGEEEQELKKACIRATIPAIKMEIKNTEQKLNAAKNGPGDPANIPVFEKRIQELKMDLEKYSAMNPDSYTLPEKKTVSILVSHVYQEGTILELENITRSGPFYHITGIRGDNYKNLKTGNRYNLTIYFIYKRDYPFTSNYVYVSDYSTPHSFSLSPRQTGEEILEELTLKSNTVIIKVGSNGGTDKNSFRVDVKKEEGISAKAPHYVLTFYRIKPDECKAIVEDGVLITYSLEKDLGLTGVYTFSVVNRISIKHQD